MTTTPGTMRRSTRTSVAMAAAALVLLTTVALGALRDTTPAGAAADDRPVTGYTLLREGADVEMVCRLVSIDWASGEITELPAIESTTACARDLAVAPDGTVHGIDPNLYSEPGVAGDVCPIAVETIGHFITYSADGTPTAIDMHLPQPYEMDFDLYGQFWGVAIAEDGTIFIALNDLWARVTTCAPGPVFTALDHSTADGAFDWTSCLFTLDPDTGDLTLVARPTSNPHPWPHSGGPRWTSAPVRCSPRAPSTRRSTASTTSCALALRSTPSPAPTSVRCGSLPPSTRRPVPSRPSRRSPSTANPSTRG